MSDKLDSIDDKQEVDIKPVVDTDDGLNGTDKGVEPIAVVDKHEDINERTGDEVAADKDEDESRSPEMDKSADDSANPIPSPESESERRCTSASNAGESEYESADDEEAMHTNEPSFEDTVTEHYKSCTSPPPETSTVTDSEEISVPTIGESVAQNESILSEQTVDKEVSNESNSETIVESNDSNPKDIVNENESQIESKLTEEVFEESPEDSVDLCDTKNVDNSTSNVDTEVTDKAKEGMSDVNENNMSDEDDGRQEDADDMYDEYEDIDESDECSVESENDNKENEDQNEEKERQQGDGEESVDSQSMQKDKNLDQDEDKRNPQYIPKRGPFYEHDDRMTELLAAQEGQEVPVEEAPKEVPITVEEVPTKPIVIAKSPKEPEKKPKKKIWGDSDRWGHDLFKEEDQTPKSKDELVNIYGYDIRNEDDAPKARRKRHYGRGPTKYERQWQDETAYTRSGPPHTRAEQMERRRSDHNERPDRERSDRERPDKERPDRERLDRERPDRERVDRDRDHTARNSINERRERPPKERSNSERLSIDNKADRPTNRFDRKDRVERKEPRIDRRDRRPERMSDRLGERPHQRSNEMIANKGMARNDRSLNDNKKYDYEDGDKRVQPFSKDDFPELPNNDLRKKLNTNQSTQEVWKSSSRFGGHSGNDATDDRVNNEYKTEPMKIIEAIEHNNRANNYNDSNAPVVRTLTFENSKFSQRSSSNSYEYDEERQGMGRARGRRIIPESDTTSGRPLRKTVNAPNYTTYAQQKEPNDNYRNRTTGRTDRIYHSEESNRTPERYYEEDNNYGNQRDREPNYMADNMQKMSIEDKSAVLQNRSVESEQRQTKRYSALRPQQQQQPPQQPPPPQQRPITDNMSTMTPTNVQMPQTTDNRNISHPYYTESHTIQTSPYYADQTRNTYHPYMSPNAPETQPTHPTNYMPQPMPQQMPQQIPQPIAQQITQRYISQAVPPNSGDTARYISTAVPPTMVTAPVPSPQLPQAMSQTGPPPPTIAQPPPVTAYIPSFPSGYPQFPPAAPPTHVPPGYPGHVPAQPTPAHQLSLSREIPYTGPVYYDPNSQQNLNRGINPPQRRPKAAIPIVAPDSTGDGDGDKSYVSVNS